MDPYKTGQIILSLRKSKNITQSQLASMLGISDKAVSKWERGISCPDISLFPKISVLLDTDIESLMSGSINFHTSGWTGIILVNHFAIERVYSKPVVYFLISYFMLVGIKDITIISDNTSENSIIDRIKNILGDGSQYGIKISYSLKTVHDFLVENSRKNLFVVYGNCILYGMNMTRRFQYAMSYENGSVGLITNSGIKIPMLFCTGYDTIWQLIAELKDKKTYDSQSIIIDTFRKHLITMQRGTICFNITDNQSLFEASDFVRIYENSQNEKLNDPLEIATNRALLKNES